jgi:flagellar motor switch protein FliG
MALNKYEKAAIFLSTVGEDTAAEILKNFSAEEIGKITTYMTRLQKIDNSIVEEVFKEVSDIVMEGKAQIINGEDYIKKVLSKGLGEEDAEKILEMASKESPLESLKWVNPKVLSSFLASEHPQTIALILCLLEPEQAAEAISVLPEELRSDVAMRIAMTERIPDSALEEIEEVLRGRLVDIGKATGKKLGGTKAVAEILNQCDRSTEKTILEKLEEVDKDLTDSIRQLMFVFEDIINVDDRGIQMILKEISTEDLSLALKTASDTLKEKIFKNMSQRAAQILKEEMETKGPVRVSEVEKAQQNIVRIARKLEEEGKIILGGRGKEELVV